MSSTLTELQALDADNVMQTYGRLPVAFVRGEGTNLWDSDGKEYLDFLTGLAVTSLGHAHPEVAAAIADQASTLLHISNLYSSVVTVACSSATRARRPTSVRSSSRAATASSTAARIAST